jgi:leucyl/phenylalanyl-tRNA--protein transferase
MDRWWRPRPAPSRQGTRLPVHDSQITPDLLVRAYAAGIFPMADERGRVRWYAPDPRAVLEHINLRRSRSLRARLRRHEFDIRVDTAFAAVMRACADRPATWISDAFVEVYTVLHQAGFAHSVEAWQGDNLVGGLYGVAVGGVFCGESMFSRVTDASKVCLVALVDRLAARGFVLHDVQFLTPHLVTLGATTIPRAEYERRLAAAIQLPVTFA